MKHLILAALIGFAAGHALGDVPTGPLKRHYLPRPVSLPVLPWGRV